MHLTNCALLLLAGILPALSFVIPDERVSNQVFLGHPAEDSNLPADGYPEAVEKLELSSVERFRAIAEKITKWHQALERLAEKQTAAKDDANPDTAIDDAFEPTKPNRGAIPESYEYWDSDAWVSHYENSVDALFSSFPHEELHDHHNHKHKCHHHEPEDEDGPQCQGDSSPHHGPNPPFLLIQSHCPQKPPTNSTLFDLISHSKQLTILYNFVSKDEELTKILKDTRSNTTLFAPDNSAFKKLPPHDPSKGPKDLIRRVLLYHLVNGTHGLLDTLYRDTLITKLPENELGKGIHQRLRLGLGLQGPTVNYYSKIVKANIFAKNGVIHAVDSILFPPPTALEIVELFPTVFSTSELAFRRAGLADELKKSHDGFTLFLPSNDAWKRLGYKLNAFLFSEAGRKCLEELMKYHIVPGHTLYSDAHVVPAKKKELQSEDYNDPSGLPQGHSSVLLPTLLKDRNITADITRYGRFLSFKINKSNHIIIPDGIAKNGVIHVPHRILVPPFKKHKSHHGDDDDEQPFEEMDVETFQARLLSYAEPEL